MPNIVGVKEASGSLDAVSKLVEELGPRFHVWSGDDQLTLPLLAVGGYGVICVSSHLVGRQIKGMIEAYLRRSRRRGGGNAPAPAAPDDGADDCR